MKLQRLLGFVFAVLACGLTAWGGTQDAARITKTYLATPLAFEQNQGQSPKQAQYISRGGGYTLLLTPQGALLSLSRNSARGMAATPSTLRMKLVGASASAARSESLLPGVSNYLIGNDPSKWRTGVARFAKVRYRDVYPGIDLVYYGNQRQLEYDFVVAPGADPKRIRMEFDGVESMRLDANGDLVLACEGGEVRQHKPLVYQQDGGKRREVAGRYVIDGRKVSFRLARYDARKPLVVDPKISYSTYLGSSSDEGAFDIAVDDQGNAYITGITGSSGFPTTAGALDTSFGPNPLGIAMAFGDAFITKLAADGKTLLYSTFLGGNGADGGNAIAVDSSGNVVVCGAATSTDFPLSANAYQTALKGSFIQSAMFVTKLNASGNRVLYSTFLGGGSDLFEITFEGAGLALDSKGIIYVAGQTTSKAFPTKNAAQSSQGGGDEDGFVAKFDPSAASGAASLVYSTYLGGSANDTALVVIPDSDGSAYVRGGTCSSNFPTTANAYQTSLKGKCDAFLTKVSSDGKQFQYSTYLGGAGYEYGYLEGASSGPLAALIGSLGVTIPTIYSSEFGGSAYGSGMAIGSDGVLHITGATTSTDFPVTQGCYQSTSKGGGLDAFYVKMDIRKAGSAALIYSTYLGGNNFDRALAVAVDGKGQAFIRGETKSNDFPTTADATQKTLGGGYDAFLTKFDSTGKATFSTFLGGNNDEQTLFGLRLDAAGNAYIAGASKSGNYPTTTGAYQTVNKGLWDAVVTKIEFEQPVTGPSFTAGGVTNAANYVAGKVSPGEIIVIFGKDFGPAAIAGLQLANGKVATEIGETRVLFDDVAAPMVYAINGQISCVVPYEVAGKATTQIAVEYKKVKGAAVAVPVVEAVPGLFSINSSGTGPGAFLNQDNSVNTAANPLDRGKIAIFYGTGEGQTSPGGVSGLPATTTFPAPLLPVTVTIGGKESKKVHYAGAAPGMVAGVIQINAEVPTDIPAGNAEVIIKVGNNSSQTGVTLAVK
jgi:uncharacterized protein (TIGR03437 family)